MSAAEDVRFELRSKEFNKAIENYSREDDNAWSFIENRQQEIMDSAVSNERKFRAFDGVLAALHNIFPRSNTAYCQALEKQLTYVNKKNPSDLERMAKDAYFHSHGVDIMQYGKVIYGTYKLSKDKENFPYRDIAKYFRKKQLKQEKKAVREDIEERVRELDFYLEDPQTDAVRKLGMVDEILDIIQDKYFGYDFFTSVTSKIGECVLQEEEVSAVKYMTIEDMEMVKERNNKDYSFVDWTDEEFNKTIKTLKDERKSIIVNICN